MTDSSAQGRLYQEVLLTIEERDLISIFMFGESGIYSRKFTWNDLMPVVEKIESIAPTRVKIDCNECTIIGDKRFKVHTMVKLHSVYKCIIQFIKWYNSKKVSHGK